MSSIALSLPARGETERTGWHSVGAWMISISYVLFCISDTMLVLEMDGSQLVKVCAVVMLCLAIGLRPKFHRQAWLILPLMLSLYVGMWRTFNVSAGLDELMRFMVPMGLSVALFAYRKRLSPVVFMFFAVVVSNDIFQCYFYVAYLLKLPLLIPVRTDSGIYLRAQGWIGFFSVFGFINFCAFILCLHYRPSKQSRRWAWVFLVFSLLSFSFKIFATLAVYAAVSRRLNIRSILSVLVGLLALVGAYLVGWLDGLIQVATTKLSFYVVAGNSARAESYRVMFESLGKWNFLGEGLGSFGGPASVRYHSPLYSRYHFNWYGLQNTVSTTDTFYPHLFVEMGMIGGVIWLWFMLSYGQLNRRNRIWMFIVAAFCFDNIFSMSFVSASYVFAALLLMYLFSAHRPLSERPSRRTARLTEEIR
ncbi:hypothetical protein GXB81_16090 [Paraburkholderia sp. Ac-20336]|uniref:hypothetical protein n=1 Tax=unclassified Paraburkholderia TaxID=2615204 RepID=UPI0014217121|nr:MULTISPECIES: hypothetical protein [unclassified Paraburkholderia]MBN3804557.1 hypothetical protein [Paraburkholderia sp. Ac-20336]NIF80956.1 hypothetical protein [Paraburkholderia sp. Cy-641]